MGVGNPWLLYFERMAVKTSERGEVTNCVCIRNTQNLMLSYTFCFL